MGIAPKIRMADAAPAGDRGGFRGGLDPCDQAWPSCKGWKDQEFGGNLPFLSSHQGARDHRYVYRPCREGRGAEDHARAEADQGWSEDQVQGFRCYWRLQWPCWSGCEVLQGGGHCYPWCHHPG